MRALLVLTLVLLAGCVGSGSEISKAGSGAAASNPVPKKVISGIPFYTSVEEGMREAETSGKAVLLYFRSDTCPWCMKFEKEVLPKNEVSWPLRDNFVLVAVDVYDSGNMPVMSRYRVSGTPTFVFLDSRGELIQGLIGFQDEDRFLMALDGALKK